MPGLQLFLFRRKYKDVLAAMNGPTGFKAMLGPLVDIGLVEIVKMEIRFRNGPGGSFVGGSSIQLNHCFHEDTVFDFKSYEFHVLGLEETTEFTPFQIKFLRSRVRMPDSVVIPERYRLPTQYWLRPDKPRYSFPRCIYPTNPGGPGHEYLKAGFVDAAEPYELHVAPESDGGMLRQFIPGLVSDNPSVDPEQYSMTLSGLPPAYRDALLKGLWTAAIGSFYPEYNNDVHMCHDFDIPDHWFRFRTFDWGSTDPFCVHWWAYASETCIKHGRLIPRGALICYREWYGALRDDGSKGLGLRNEEVARGILDRSEPDHKTLITLADSFPFAERGGPSIAWVFQQAGVPLTRADDSRVAGWSHLRDRLIGIELEPDRPRIPLIMIFKSCQHLRYYLPMLQHHPSDTKPKDAEEHGEATHCCDSARYASMAHAVIKELKLPTRRTPEPSTNMSITAHQALKTLKRRDEKSGRI